MQMRGRALRLEPEDLARLSLPAVLHWDMDHFVVLKKVGWRHLTIHDPAIGVRRYRAADLGRHFTGVAVELSPASGFVAGKTAGAENISLRQLLRSGKDLPLALLQVLVLSVLVQLLALLAPMYLQLVIDQGISRGDMALVRHAGFAVCPVDAGTHPGQSYAGSVAPGQYQSIGFSTGLRCRAPVVSTAPFLV